jgi:hypothetical protein
MYHKYYPKPKSGSNNKKIKNNNKTEKTAILQNETQRRKDIAEHKDNSH